MRKNRGLDMTNPDPNNAILRETPHIYHTLCILRSPKLGNLMKKLLMIVSNSELGKRNDHFVGKKTGDIAKDSDVHHTPQVQRT